MNPDGFERVFAYYPRGLETGGPEALHQLVDALRKLSVEAYLVPYNWTRSNKRATAYSNYDAPEATEITDDAMSAVIAPEVDFGPLASVEAATRACWWLSVDNARAVRHQKFMIERESASLKRRAKGTAYRWLHQRQDHRIIANAAHLTQSYYSWAFLQTHYGVLAEMLSDYTVISEAPGVVTAPKIAAKPLSVAFNPRKGREELNAIRTACDIDVAWRPIEGLTKDGVRNLLRSSDVYLDTGHHPGKDRLPREAAASGCVTLTIRRGSAAYEQDVPIPEEHKFDPGGEMTSSAIRTLKLVAEDIARSRAKQDAYRQVIRAEQSAFNDQADRLFAAGRLRQLAEQARTS